jgi:hypothetical protein
MFQAEARAARDADAACARCTASRTSAIIYDRDEEMTSPPACAVCGYPVFDAKNHDIPAARAVKMFPVFPCKCGKAARIRCFSGLGTCWVECDDGHGHGRGRPS